MARVAGLLRKSRGEAQRSYRKFVREAFGEIPPGPWKQLRGALVLGCEAFYEKAKARLSGKSDQEEVKWRRREVDGAARRVHAHELAAGEAYRTLQAWLRVIAGGERRRSPCYPSWLRTNPGSRVLSYCLPSIRCPTMPRGCASLFSRRHIDGLPAFAQLECENKLIAGKSVERQLEHHDTGRKRLRHDY